MFRLLRYFSMTSLVSIVAVAAALGWFYRDTAVRGLGKARGLVLGRTAAVGRVWLLDWNRGPLPLAHRRVCARPWSRGSSRVVCLR